MKIIHEGLDKFVPWSGAISTWERIQEENKQDALESTLEDLYPDGMTETELNDLLWFDEESVYEWLGIDPDEDSEESEE